MPKISVIVPVYNVEKHLDKCLGSILSQTFTDFELLLINDGSLDNSGKICDEYAENDDRIRVFHKKNGGVSSARNLGLDNAQGEWIAFIDSDDWVEKTYLEHLFINNDKYEFSVMGYIDQWKISIDNKPEYDVFINKNFIKFYEQYITTPLEGCVWGCLLSLAIINKIQLRFDENLSFGEDNLFLSDYFENISTIQVINYSDYHKTFDNNTLSSIANLDQRKSHLKVYRSKILKLLQDFPSSLLLKKHLAKLYLEFAVFSLAYNIENINSAKERRKNIRYSFDLLHSQKYNYMSIARGMMQKTFLLFYYSKNVFFTDTVLLFLWKIKKFAVAIYY